MEQGFRWVILWAWIMAWYYALESSARYIFGSPSLLNILPLIFFGLCWLLVLIKVGNWIARTIGLETLPKKGRPWWYDRHDNY